MQGSSDSPPSDRAQPILLPVDSADACEPAVVEAMRLASEQHRPVVVLHVHEYASRGGGELRTCCPDGAEPPSVAVAQRLRNAGIEARQLTTSTMHEATSVAGEIRKVADGVHAGMIVVSSRGRGDVASIALGSVTHRLLHRQTVPVLVVPRRAEADQHVRQPDEARSIS